MPPAPPSQSTAGHGHTPHHAFRLGTGLGILSALAYTGANIALRQAASRDDVDWAIWVSCMKAVPAAGVAWLLIAYRACRGLPALPPRQLVLPLVLTGVMMQFVGNVSLQWALSQGGLVLTVPLMFATLIVSGAWLGRIFLGEPVTYRSAAAMGALILSIVLLSVGAETTVDAAGAPVSMWRVVFAVVPASLAGIAYGACGVVIRSVVTRNISLSATLVLLSTTGVVLLGATSLVRLGPDQILNTPAADFDAMLAAGALNAVAFFSIGAALRYITVVRANLLNASQAAMCAAAGVVLFSEVINVWLAAGIGTTLAGLMMMDGVRRPKIVPASENPPPSHDAVERRSDCLPAKRTG